MKKGLSLILAFVLLLSCALSALAEDGPSAPQEQEMADALAWMMQDLSEDERLQVVTWDKDTILQKLAGYDQPLQYTTKEEIADQLSMVLGLLGMVKNAAENSENGEGLAAIMNGLLGAALEGGDNGNAGMLGLVSLYGGLNGASMSFGGDESEDWAGEGIISAFDSTYWECGDLKMEIVFQDGYYKVAVLEGDTELSYLCKYEENTEGEELEAKLIGIGTGDEEMNAVQLDHGITEFIWDVWHENLIWNRNGEALVFTRIIDPLDESEWVGSNKKAAIQWHGDLNYTVTITQPPFDTWVYQCTLNRETNTLEGTGGKEEYNRQVYASKATFAFNENRTALIWTDEKEPETAEGLALTAVCSSLLYTTWRNDHYALIIFNPDGFGRYAVHVYVDEMAEGWEPAGEATEENVEDDEVERVEYCYLCTYDWENSVFKALEPASIDFDSLEVYQDPELFTSTATFVLQDENHILWLDDSGLSGDGQLLERESF